MIVVNSLYILCDCTIIPSMPSALQGLGERSVSVSDMEADLSDIIPPAEGGVASKEDGPPVLAEGPPALSKCLSIILVGFSYLCYCLYNYIWKISSNVFICCWNCLPMLVYICV